MRDGLLNRRLIYCRTVQMEGAVDSIPADDVIVFFVQVTVGALPGISTLWALACRLFPASHTWRRSASASVGGHRVDELRRSSIVIAYPH